MSKHPKHGAVSGRGTKFQHWRGTIAGSKLEKILRRLKRRTP